jgi:hypothetical protein
LPSPNVTLEELRSGIKRPAGKLHQLVLKRIPAHFLELDVGFAFNSGVFLPVAPAGSQGDKARSAPFEVLRGVFAFAEQNPGKHLLIAGHTDTSGSPSYNRKLSELRAQCLHALLKGDRDAWASVCEQRHAATDIQTILAWAAREHGFGCDPGEIDGAIGPQTAAARERFRTRYNTEFAGNLTVQGPQSQADWKAYYDLYEVSLARMLGVAEGKLASKRSLLQFLAQPTLGCGEHFPVGSVGIDGLRSATNRRVDFVFFDEPGFPSLSAQEPPGRDLYAGDLRFKRQLPEPKPEAVLQFVDDTGMPLADVGVTVRKAPDGPEQQERTDAFGIVRLPGARGEAYEFLRFEEKLALVIVESDSALA